jgi:hypothetical protein
LSCDTFSVTVSLCALTTSPINDQLYRARLSHSDLASARLGLRQTNMAFRANDDMNEFFDFDQLECDHGAQAATGPEQQHVDPFHGLGDGMSMDWASHDLVPLPAADAFLHGDIQTSKDFDHISSHGGQQWPPAEMHCIPLRETQVCIDPFSIQDVDATPCQSPLTATAPLLSLSASDRQPISSDHGMIDPFDVARTAALPPLDVPIFEITAPLAPDNVGISNRGRSSVPLRQASVSSWKPASAKRKGPQSRIPLEARQILEDEFAANPYPVAWEMDIIAHQANLDVKKVRNWFNNTRARQKGGGTFLCLLS